MYADDNGVLRYDGGTVEDHWTTVTYEEREGYVLRTFVEEYVEEFANPRADTINVGVMLIEHRDYNLGEGTRSSLLGRDDFRSEESLVRYLELVHGARCIHKLYLYDHSGISLSMGGTVQAAHAQSAHMGWDTSHVGFIYATTESLKACGFDADVTDEAITGYLQGEVQCYDEYLRGEVYGWEVISPDGDIIESCGLYVGDGHKYALDEGQSMFTHVLRDVLGLPAGAPLPEVSE